MFSRRNHPSRPSSKSRKRDRQARLGLDRLEDRRLLSGDPALNLSIAPTSFAENAGTGASVVAPSAALRGRTH